MSKSSNLPNVIALVGSSAFAAVFVVRLFAAGMAA